MGLKKSIWQGAGADKQGAVPSTTDEKPSRWLIYKHTGGNHTTQIKGPFKDSSTGVVY